jgi:hypothetical protein
VVARLDLRARRGKLQTTADLLSTLTILSSIQVHLMIVATALVSYAVSPAFLHGHLELGRLVNDVSI